MLLGFTSIASPVSKLFIVGQADVFDEKELTPPTYFF